MILRQFGKCGCYFRVFDVVPVVGRVAPITRQRVNDGSHGAISVALGSVPATAAHGRGLNPQASGAVDARPSPIAGGCYRCSSVVVEGTNTAWDGEVADELVEQFARLVRSFSLQHY
jgi:hypothetical protein